MLVVWYLATDRIKQSTSMQTVLSNQPTYLYWEHHRGDELQSCRQWITLQASEPAG